MAEIKLKPCRFCNAEAFVMYGGDTGREDAETTISCQCKMSPMVAALFYNDAVKMWNAAMTHESKLRTLLKGYEALCADLRKQVDDGLRDIEQANRKCDELTALLEERERTGFMAARAIISDENGWLYQFQTLEDWKKIRDESSNPNKQA